MEATRDRLELTIAYCEFITSLRPFRPLCDDCEITVRHARRPPGAGDPKWPDHRSLRPFVAQSNARKLSRVTSSALLAAAYPLQACRERAGRIRRGGVRLTFCSPATALPVHARPGAVHDLSPRLVRRLCITGHAECLLRVGRLGAQFRRQGPTAGQLEIHAA